ncbi:hypothetical protein CPB86DRAFT_783981 [Serendipita vermifera]|nr:hypothetical protein CPB86DRAFT_783981 [Serendipita vermifera]
MEGAWPRDQDELKNSQNKNREKSELRTTAKSEIEALLGRTCAPPTILEVWEQFKEFSHELERSSALDRLHRRRFLMRSVLSGLDSSSIAMLREPLHTPYQTNIDGTKIWAVLIGIDHYANIPALEGAVRDTRNMEEYLLRYLNIPTGNIRLLIDHDATRDNILEAISQHLTNNVNLQPGDPIIVYYAGHGSSYEAREAWDNGIGSIEALCPIDRGDVDPYGDMVLDISDREIFFMLKDLRSEKGNNITFILDCCHASGISRGEQKKISGAKIRAAMRLPSLAEEMLKKALDNPYRRSDYSSAMDVDWKADMENIAMLAACHDYESAWEITVDGISYGAFTTALLKTLKTRPLDETTYSQVIQDIGHLPSAKVPRQHPLAIGGRIQNSPFSNSQPIARGTDEQ